MAGITARVKGVYKPSDFPGSPDETTTEELKALFEYVGVKYPESDEPEVTGYHAGIGMAARNPRLALAMLKATHVASREKPWSDRLDLRELAIQAVNLYFKCDYAFQAHIELACKYGVPVELQALLPFWKTANAFTDEQRLVLAYVNAVCAGDVPGDLFAGVVKQFGEKETIDLTSLIGIFSSWAMIINATRPEFKFDFGAAAAKARG
jgi:alkylhydroperoxidase family enzyme